MERGGFIIGFWGAGKRGVVYIWGRVFLIFVRMVTFFFLRGELELFVLRFFCYR